MISKPKSVLLGALIAVCGVSGWILLGAREAVPTGHAAAPGTLGPASDAKLASLAVDPAMADPSREPVSEQDAGTAITADARPTGSSRASEVPNTDVAVAAMPESETSLKEFQRKAKAVAADLMARQVYELVPFDSQSEPQFADSDIIYVLDSIDESTNPPKIKRVVLRRGDYPELAQLRDGAVARRKP